MTRATGTSRTRKARPAYRMIHGDAREEVPRVKENSVDAVVTDPPFELGRPGRRKGGYLGQGWDRSGIAFDVEFWTTVARAMKPGAHLVTFGHETTVHRLMVALEEAGLEIRHLGAWLDAGRIAWSKDAVRLGADARQWKGWGTALKTSTPIVYARKPVEPGLSLVENLAKWKTGAFNIDACRHPPALDGADGRWPATVVCSDADIEGPALGVAVLGPGLTSDHKRAAAGARKLRRSGMGYASTAAGNEALVHGDGSASLDGVLAPYTRFFRVAGSDDSTLAVVPGEVLGRALPTVVACPRASTRETGLDGAVRARIPAKPVALMRHIVRLVTPLGGLVLDPFAGTGTTGVAALWEGKSFVGVEQSNAEDLPLVDVSRARLRRARTTPAPALTPRTGSPRSRATRR